MRTFLLLVLSISIVLISCDRGPVIEPVVPEEADVIMNRTYPNADERLWLFFVAFENEARERGLNFDLKELNILGIIEIIEENGVAGHCKYGSHIDNEVTIDSDFWNRSNSTFREFVVFHELGHCVLLRDHDETELSNGTCESIMRSGVEDCSDNYNVTTRDRYLDELFLLDNS